jgi:predicted transcriptional regulator
MGNINVELPEEALAELRRLAAERATTVESLAAGAILGALGEDAALDTALAEAEAEIAEGKGIAHEEVMREMRDWAAALRARGAAR